MASATFKKYGLDWPAETLPLDIEFYFIRAGGKLNAHGVSYGEGLVHHYLAARRIIWPHRYEHRWTRLMYEEITKNQITILLGAASTQKTSHASEWVLIDYWAFPNNTLCLVTTTTVEKLETNVFAEIKSLWEQGHNQFPHLSGHVVDHMHAIFTDDLEDEGTVRDRRKGIVGKACMIPGTLVDTPSGPVPIECIRTGDLVLNACGVGTVKAKMLNWSTRLVRVHLADGRAITCTPDHPFLTANGWKQAVDIPTGGMVFSANETLQILRKKPEWTLPEQDVLFHQMQTSRTHMQGMREPVQEVSTWKNDSEVLQLPMRHELAFQASGISHKILPGVREDNEPGASQPHLLLPPLQGFFTSHPMSSVRNTFSSGAEKDSTYSFLQSCLRNEMGDDSAHEGTPEAHTTDRSRDGHSGLLPAGSMELPRQIHTEQKQRASQLVQNRRGLSRHQISGGTGRWDSSHSDQCESGQDEEFRITGTRVDRVEIVEPSRLDGYCHLQGAHPVYNIEVSGHPSYSVNGIIVHNCYDGKQWVGDSVFVGIKQQRVRFLGDELQYMAGSFIRSWNPLFSNPDLKIIGSGNPNHNPDDPLGIAAEPKGGWASLDEPDKTTCWDARRLNSRCVNLVGTDSPNLEVAEGLPEPYPGLIGRKFINRIIHDSGPDSPDFYRLVKGVMKFSLAHTRVITRQLCKEHRAHDKAVWLDNAHTQIYATDPAYGGGDRCIGGRAKFGKDLQGKQILCVYPPRVIQINMRQNKTPEDQIADAVFDDLTAFNIPAENCFYGAFGKGTIGYAFARKFGRNPPVPIDEGGRPSRRPVREDLKLLDEATNELRHKRCDEHFDRRISELWFMARYAVESEQIKELPESVMEEGCVREYTTVAGSKISVETKDDLKERIGFSPDLFDWFTFILEGARQRGFLIDRLGPPSEDDEADEDWFSKEAKEHDEMMRSKLLQHK